MNKAELIEVVAARIDASKKDAAEAVQAVVDAITEAVAKGQKVSISGFGVFEKAARPARTYRTPSTGEAIQKLATAVPKFRPGGDFRAFVAGDKNVSDIARAAQAAGDDVMSQASQVVRRVTRKPAAKASEAAATAPAKKATATAKKASTASKATATKAASTAKSTTAAAKKSTTAAAKKTTSTAARKTTAAAKKAPAAAPRTRATAKKAAPAAPETPAESPE